MLKLKNGTLSIQQFIKKLFDFIFGILLLTIFSPVILLAVLAIKFDSSGPAFFKQRRVGKDRKEFVCYKLRSMHSGASDQVHKEYIKQLMQNNLSVDIGNKSIYKLTDDKRVTRVGRFIRRTSIDELPQLFNVVKGDMSLVGPRPAIGYELEFYTLDMLERFNVKPGITGLWQVGGRSGLSYRQMVEKDICYIKNWSFFLDLKILIKTALYVLNVSRAY